ncbi:tRNA dihydrouridine synthase [Methanococcoides alaskense]|uniref:NifR3 family TIM-barrel protein n=1 Tax=Methanococcoides alaskense TaxID=325778 RepID=A0AA90Z7L8_9EURY|nr:tRNA-dihydrouridine synthase family protein [Methanococcoides alaskense]MDA0524094.1 tRNA-dihydrouridine synthase family protein [Methanococcoides alaskense]MDR6222544.1 nifR3 family TIM-barrel protein [Methanococcoides alaskense]
MRLGRVDLPGDLLLAPLAEVTNLAFRLMCKKYGASLCFSEMISSEAVVHGNDSSVLRGMTCDEERPFAVQLFGNSPDVVTEAALVLEDLFHPAIIDINLGCPAPVITNAGCGSALLDSPERVSDILSTLCEGLDTPVTAKIRVLESPAATLDIAHRLEDAGVCGITVHGRTREQGYSGTADHSYAKLIKEELSIPVISNGDIRDGVSAEKVLEYTGCDGLMIGRAAMGDPHVFHRISRYLDDGEVLECGCEQKRDDLLEYLDLLEKFDLSSHINLKAHVQWFTRGLKGSRRMRSEIGYADSRDSIVEFVQNMCEKEFV